MFSENGLDQQVININQDIFNRIRNELQNAKSEILIATAWFTDDEIFDVLKGKIDEGIKVELIIADNEKNNKLDLNQLTLKGASVFRIQNIGYGMMHEKFCVVDRKVAIHGSFNLTVNAKKNNQESVIVTNHPETIGSLVSNFSEMKQKALGGEAEEGKQNLRSLIGSFFGKKRVVSAKVNDDENEPVKARPNISTSESVELDSQAEYKRVLDSMIAAEVSNFDRSLLRQQGYDRAKNNNGDAQVLNKGLDSVYSVFINEINVVEDKKKRLIAKVEEQKIKSINSLQEHLELQLNTIETETETTKGNLSNKVTNLQTQISIHEKEIDGLKNNKISSLEQQNQNTEQKIKASEREFVKPAFKWFEFIPALIISTGLLAYLILFYSSAAYILLFSELDAKEAKLQNITLAPPEVFNPEAISMALDKGGSAPYFIFLFVFLPLTFALLGKLVQNKILANILSFGVGVIIVDSALAYTVAKTIHNVEYLSGNVDTIWHYSMVLEDINFYLVFILGAFGLLLFKFAFDKFISIFEERNPDISARRNQKYIKQSLQEIEDNKKKIFDYKEEIEGLEKKIIQCQSEVDLCEAESGILPVRKTNLQDKVKAEHSIKVQGIERTTDIYKSHIENDNLRISVDSIKDRINVFLEGWNDFLHHEYAVAKAIEMSGKAANAATNWQNEKLSTNKLDGRIKA